MYILKRTDHGGGYVTKPGSHNSYTRDLRHAKIFNTKEEAEQDRCKENEIIVSVHDILQP